MQKSAKFISVLLLICILAGTLASCAPSSPPSVSQPPEESAPQSTDSPDPTPAVTADTPPIATGDIPAIQPDEETTLNYTVNGADLTVSALRHYTLYGYSIVYDAEDLTQFFTDVNIVEENGIQYLKAMFKGKKPICERVLNLDAERYRKRDLPLANLLSKYCSYMVAGNRE